MISVIIPVYQVENDLRCCLDSLLAQTYTDFEAILVDDGSLDNCGKICEEYVSRDVRFRVIHQENKGLSEARNVGLKEAGGEYLALVDSDDVLHPNYLEQLYNNIRACHAQVAICRYETVPEESLLKIREDFTKKPGQTGNFMETCSNQIFTGKRKDALPADIVCMEAKPDGVCVLRGREAARLCVEKGLRFAIVAHTKLYHRSLLPLLHYPEGKCHEDEFVTYRVLYACDRVAVSNRAYYGYVKRADSITGTYSLKRMDGIDARREAVAYFEERKDMELALAAKKRLLLYLPAVWYFLYGAYRERTDLLENVRRQQETLWEENKRVLKSGCSLTDRISLLAFHISPRLYCVFAGLYLKLVPEK